ncbi:hypothetical protein ASG75_04980 [Rhodanobacter sp. Soil772]|uniref:hypothetical protein n=1 Tax=Rhodanobacter sp. Soil772 TaxID=1736406 RepID=UPI0006F875F3|nr:hypothetical protein [Rhodanobacter sp. Soil772]KRE87481.1 hypothetical protein ASG75_04980 [Rhodanobacter sp. Soil772]
MWNYNAYTNLPQKIYGWQIDNSTASGIDLNARCSHFDVPPTFVRQLGDPALSPWDPEDWWKGYHLVIPGESGQDMLSNVDASTKSSYPVVTKSHWRFSCLPTTSNGQPGEAFLGQAPDGTLYWFDELVYRGAPGMTRPLYYSGASVESHSSGMVAFANRSVETLISVLSGSTMAHAVTTSDGISRSLGLLLVTKVQDRFGNTLNYSYDTNGYLTGITASDGRALSVTYVPNTHLIQSVTLQPLSGAARTWTYAYSSWSDGTSLNAVTLPDGTQWRYNLTGFDAATLSSANSSSCIALAVPGNLGPTTGTITHPSGLTGTFTVMPLKHGRSYVTRGCVGMQNNDPSTAGSYALVPDAWYSLTATQLTTSGAGIPSQTWSYNYSPANDSWADCTGSCPTTIWSDVVAPDGSTVRHIFSNRFGMTESQLLRTEYYAGAAGSSTLLRSEDDSYAPPTTAPLPAIAGVNLQSLLNADQTTKYSPLNQRVITQDGDTYTWQAEAFDQYAQVTQTKRFNSIAGQNPIEEATTYLNDTSLWALGLPQQVTNLATGEVESLNTYSTSNDTLQSRARFGQTLMNYTFNSAGQLASFTDSNSHTTSLSNYKRGIPQTIGYPDGISETLVVDDFGQISAITDQAGHTTSYGYDSVGRMTGITYPGGDEEAWLPKTFSYDFVTSDERGVPANHWRRTTTTGSAVGVTYFDAMLRPVLTDSDIGANVQVSTLTTYDAKGQKTFSAYPSATALTFTQTPAAAGIKGVATTYDALERVVQVQQDSELGVLTSSTAYLSGARQQVTDPKGNVTTTSYQVFDSPSDDAPIQVQAPTGITQSIARDLYGNPLSITQSGLYSTESDSVTKTLTYDSYHRLCRTTEPESGSEVMAYDAANNLAWSAQGLAITGTGCGQEQVAAGAQTTRTYDAMNRVKTLLPPAGTQSTTYGYDPVGRLTSAVSGISTWSGTYNFRGMLTGESLQLTGQNAWGLGYAHDAYGSLTLIHYPDGENVSYAPDALGRPTQAGSYATGIGYFPNGQIAQFAYANGTSYVAEQNARQLLRNFSYGVSSTMQLSEDLSYDANGNITAVADLTGGPRNKSFGYDALNRLASANAAGLWGTQAYTYDALNNLRTLQTGSQVSTYHYDTTNKLTSISSGATTLTSYLYDTRGNVTGKNATTLVFDQKNQLTRIAGGGTYAYDASGRRVSKTVGGATTYYFYNQAGQLMYQWAPGSALSTSFVYLGSKLIGDNETIILSASASVGFDANPNNGSYTVSWGAVPGATSYLLQESANGGGWTTAYNGAATSAVLSGRAGGSYVYRVEGCIGATCGGWTTSATLGVRPALPTVTVPTGTINGTYTVSWTTPASATGYDVQERVNGGGWTTIASNTAATAISRPGTSSGSYTYQVSANNAYGSRGWAASGAVTVDTTYGVVPTAPASLSVPASSSTGSATLSWSASSLTTSYTLQQSSNGGTSWSAAYTGSAPSAALTGLADGSYVYRVQACNTYGCSAWTAGSATLVVTHPPATAPGLSVPASSASGSYTVSWGGVSGATSYTLQEQVNGGAWTTVQANSLTSWSTSGHGNGTYGYRVQACNVGGCGPWSTTGSTTVLLPPAAPASISVPATSSGSIAVSWVASATATSYTLQQRLGTGSWGTVYTGAATNSTRTVTTSGSYTYQVQACNAGGCSAYKASSTVAVTIPPASAPSLSVPSSSSNGSYTVSWGAVTAATSYTLQEQVNGGAWATVQANGNTSWSISGKSNGTYGYHAQACNAGGCGPWSGVGSVSVALVPAPPANPTVTDTVAGKIETYGGSWSAVSNATRYEVLRVQTSSTIYSGTGLSTPLESGSVGFEPQYSYNLRACNDAGCSAWERLF